MEPPKRIRRTAKRLEAALPLVDARASSEPRAGPSLPEFAASWPLKPFYATPAGVAYCNDALDVLRAIPKDSIRLILTSPPYALERQKEYGNATKGDYLAWFDKFVPEFKRVLTADGSLVLNIGGSWEPGEPVRSLYHYRLLLRLVDEHKLHLAQDFFWFNTAKMPNPAQWVNVNRWRVKDAVEPIWWLSKSKRPHANNRNVLRPYTKSMENLFKYGYNAGERPSGWKVSKVWGRNNGGAIPPNFLAELEPLVGDAWATEWLSNVLALPNTDSNSRYLKACRETAVKPHPARFPRELPEFFIRFLTEKDDVVLDPFAGSNMTGEVAETEGRRWVATELRQDYLSASAFRFATFLTPPRTQAERPEV